MKWYQNKKVWIITGVVVILAGIGGYVATHVKWYRDGSASISIIGGADGPTSIFLAGKLPGKEHASQDAAQNESQNESQDAAQNESQMESPDSELSTMPLDMTMRVIGYEDGIVTVEIDNHSGYEMGYGEEYTLQRLEGEEWVDVQPEKEYAWKDVLHTIPDLTVVKETYDLTVFGNLPAGKYKLVKNDLEAEFEITAGTEE